MVTRPRTLLAAYAVSGFASLGYQVVWLRVFADHFGSTSLTFLLVIVNFIAGLGLGALAAPRVEALVGRTLRTADRLRVYGAIEVLVCAGVLATPVLALLPADLLGAFPYSLNEGIYQPTAAATGWQVVVALACLFPPTFLMGATYPLLCDASREDARYPSLLYAWNTLGACVGVLVCEFWLLSELGQGETLWLLLALNASVGLGFLTVGGAGQPQGRATSNCAQRAGDTLPVSTLILAATLGGVMAGAIEGDAFKRLWFLGLHSSAAMAFVAFWAVLAIFAASTAVRIVQGLRLRHLQVGVSVGMLFYALLAVLAWDVLAWLDEAYAAAAVGGRDALPVSAEVLSVLRQSPAYALAATGLWVFIPMFTSAMLLPWACNRAQGDERLLSRVYGMNTLAFCLGFVALAWLAPRVNLFYSMKFALGLLGIVALGVWWLREERSAPRLFVPAALLALLAVAALTPAGFDRELIRPGRYPALHPSRALASNGMNTTWVTSAPDGERLYFDGHPMSGTGIGAQRYMRLMAHLPLLAQASPRRVLVIGFGVGNTTAGIARHRSVDRIDVVELNQRVIETAPEFANWNDRVFEDPRVRFINDDGRSYLARTDQRYDLITAEPPPPTQRGMRRLYSAEYYRDARARLTPTGMLSQWLPIRQLPEESAARIVRTFVAAFPHALLFTGAGPQLVLVGSERALDPRVVADRLANGVAVREELEWLDVNGVAALLARVLLTDAALRQRYARGRTISDERDDLLQDLRLPIRMSRVDYEPGAVHRWLEGVAPSLARELAGPLSDLGRLRWRVRDLPLSLLDVGPGPQGQRPALADADWPAIVAIERTLSSVTLPPAETAARLEQAVQLAPRDALLRGRAAQASLNAGNARDALAHARVLRDIEPAVVAGAILESQANAALENWEAALRAADAALAIDDAVAQVHAARGAALAGLDRPVEALAAYQRAVAIDPEDLRAQRGRAELVSRLRR